MDVSSPRFLDLCDKLRSNDPDTKVIMDPYSPLRHLSLEVESSYILGEAFKGNNYVTDFRVCFQFIDADSVDFTHACHGLWTAIGACSSLNQVEFTGSMMSCNLNHRFISSLARNKELRFVGLNSMSLGANSLSFLLLGSG